MGPFVFNVFINDLFLFIDNCKLYNYVDDNSIRYSSLDINSILASLRIHCNNAIDWFTVDGMKANTSKFQFMVISSERIEQKYLDIENGIALCSEPSMKVLGVITLRDVIMGAIASQITSLTIVCSIVYSDADQRKHQSSASLAFVWGIHQGPVNSPHKWPITRKMIPFDDVIIIDDRLQFSGEHVSACCGKIKCNFQNFQTFQFEVEIYNL